MDLPSQQKEELSQALLNAYRSISELERMLTFKLGSRLQEVVSPGPLRNVVFDLVEWAEAEGRLDELIAGSHAHNPGNTMVRQFYNEHFALVDQQGLHNLESIILPNNQFQDIAHWRSKLQEIEGRVCQIKIEGIGKTGWGTGFLVADDVILTNYHVVVDVREKKLPPTRVRLFFDYKRGEDGVEIEKEVSYGLNNDWLIDFSPKDHLDYALLRVEGRPGNELRGNARRGYVLVPSGALGMERGMPLIIVQHSMSDEKAVRTDPMQIAIDTQGIVGLNSNATRLEYRTNTLPGSSGAPCFNMQLALIAMHKAGTLTAGGYNQGIPVSTLRAHLEKKGLLHVLGKSLP